MAYGAKWRLEFTDELGRDKRVDILKKDYTGSITEVTGAGFSPLFTSIQNQGDPKYETVRGTEIELRVYAELQSGGSAVNFSSDTFYIAGIEPGRTPDSDSTRIQKCTFDNDGNLTYGANYDIFGTGLYINEDIDYRYMSVGKNGNVLVPSRDPVAGELHVHVWDSDLNYINSVTMSDGPYAGSRQPQRAYFGEDSNIYVTQLASDNRVRVRKYDSSLTSIWDSDYFTVEDPGGSNNNAGCVALVFFDGKVILHAGQHNDTAYYSLLSLNMSDGSLITRNDGFLTDNDFRNSVPVVKRFDDDKFVVGHHGSFWEVEVLYVFNEDLTLNKTVDQTSIGLLMIGSSSISDEKKHPFEIIPDNRYFIIGNKFTDLVKCIDPMTDELIWSASVTDSWFRMNQVDSQKLLMGSHQNDNDMHGITVLNYDGTVVFDEGLNSDPIWDTAEIDDNFISCPAMAYEGWELDYFDGIDIDFSDIITGTDTEYKIEIYEEAAAS